VFDASRDEEHATPYAMVTPRHFVITCIDLEVGVSDDATILSMVELQ